MLVSAARARGVEKILITHPFFKVRARASGRRSRLVPVWAPTPSSATARSRRCGTTPRSRKVVEAIEAIGAERAILMSDTGQRHNPMPAEALRVFAQSVHESGVSEQDVERMIKQNPSELLGLSAPPATAEALAWSTEVTAAWSCKRGPPIAAWMPRVGLVVPRRTP